MPRGDTRVWTVLGRHVAHRDPGCARLNMCRDERLIIEHDRRRPTMRRCGYCYSRAGYRRYP